MDCPITEFFEDEGLINRETFIKAHKEEWQEQFERISK